MKYYLVYKGHDLQWRETSSINASGDFESLNKQDAELLQSIFKRLGIFFEVEKYSSEQASQLKQTDPKLLAQFNTLTSREREVCYLICLGIHPKHIASKLDMMPKTVLVHRSNIYKKIGANSPIALLRQALKAGIIKARELIEYEG